MTSTDKLREFITDEIRNGYDRAPDYYKPGDNWDDGAERIADHIITGPIAELVRERDDAHKLLAEAGEVIEQVLSGYLNDGPARSILTRIKEATNNG